MKKAILIDVVNRIVTNVNIGDYKEMYPLIGNGCSLFTMPLELENGDGVFVDDEGLLHDKMVGGFMIEGYAAPLIGNAIIQGADEEGETDDCKSTVEQILAKVTFLDAEQAERWRNYALQQPIVVYTNSNE